MLNVVECQLTWHWGFPFCWWPLTSFMELVNHILGRSRISFKILMLEKCFKIFFQDVILIFSFGWMFPKGTDYTLYLEYALDFCIQAEYVWQEFALDQDSYYLVRVINFQKICFLWTKINKWHRQNSHSRGGSNKFPVENMKEG